MNTFSSKWSQADEIKVPLCEKCGCRTRLAGIEPHPRLHQTDLRTYQCLACNDVQAVAVPLVLPASI
jgi:hypothetical protein